MRATGMDEGIQSGPLGGGCPNSLLSEKQKNSFTRGENKCGQLMESIKSLFRLDEKPMDARLTRT